MEKMGLPKKFINLIKLIDIGATAKIIINGAISKETDIERGSRQGDTLSMTKFSIAVNPLIIALNKNENITKYRSFCNRKFLTLVKADNLTIVVHHIVSLFHVRHVIMRFQLASGLEMNLAKTKGIFFNKTNMHDIQNLPFNIWNENMVILGIPFGTDRYIKEFWLDRYNSFAKEVSYFQSFSYLTLQATKLLILCQPYDFTLNKSRSLL